MGSFSRTKGRAWEQAVAKLFRPIFGQQVRRGWQARSGGDAADLEGVPFWVEAKHHRQVNIAAALRQIVEAMEARPPKEPLWPLVTAKSDRQRPTATMFLDDFMVLIAEWWSLKSADPRVVVDTPVKPQDQVTNAQGADHATSTSADPAAGPTALRSAS